MYELTHTRVRDYKCVTCQKLFSHTSDLKKHKEAHSRVKHYKCVICQKLEYQNLSSLQTLTTIVTFLDISKIFKTLVFYILDLLVHPDRPKTF